MTGAQEADYVETRLCIARYSGTQDPVAAFHDEHVSSRYCRTHWMQSQYRRDDQQEVSDSELRRITQHLGTGNGFQNGAEDQLALSAS